MKTGASINNKVLIENHKICQQKDLQNFFFSFTVLAITQCHCQSHENELSSLQGLCFYIKSRQSKQSFNYLAHRLVFPTWAFAGAPSDKAKRIFRHD